MKINKEQLTQIFFNEVCGKTYIMIGKEPHYLSINYEIIDPNVKLRVVNRKKVEGYSPIIKIENLTLFQDRIYDYIGTFLGNKTIWTTSPFADNELDDIKTAFISLFTNATYQDYENSIDLIERYTDFLKKDIIYTMLKDGKQIFEQGNVTIKMQTKSNSNELETPYSFYLESIEGVERKRFPSIHYGIHNGEAYLYAVQGERLNIGGNEKICTEESFIEKLRYTIKKEGKKDEYRGAEPLAVASLIAFFEVLKKEGIQKVNVPDFLPLRYISKAENFGIENADKIQNVATNKLLLQIRRVMHYHSEGIKFLNIPGESGSFLSIDISDYRAKGISEKICEGIDKSIQDMERQSEEER